MESRGFAAAVVRGRWPVIALVLAAVAALAVPARRTGGGLDASGRIEGSESAAVADALESRFESPFARSELAVLTGVPSPATPEGRQALQDAARGIAAIPCVTRTYSYLDGSDPLFLPDPAGRRDGTVVVVGVLPSQPPDAIVAGLRGGGASVEGALRRRHPRATLRFAGAASLNLDLRRASSASVRAAETRALPLTLLLLLLAFASPLASLLPLLVGALAPTLTLGLASLLAGRVPLSVTLESVASMLGLGLGIDYALLTVSRFREALRLGKSEREAAVSAGRHAGRTVAVSGAAVALGFLGLLAVPVSEISSLGVGGMLVAAVSVTLATTLLPAILSVLGRHLDACSLRVPVWLRPRGVGEDGWRRWGRWVTRHPWIVLALAGLPMVFLAAEARRLRTDLPDGDWLPASTESAPAVRDLRAIGRSALVEEIDVLLELPEEVSALGAEGWLAQRRLERALAADPRVARVRSLRALAGEGADDPAFRSLVPGDVKRVFVSGEGDAALFALVPREDARPAELARLVRELRKRDAALITGVPGSRLRVGGLPAFNAEYEDAVAGRYALVVTLVVTGTFLALLSVFRSLLIALKALALNLLSVASALGALVLAFQDGRGGAFALVGPTGSVFPAIPVLVFTIVFGLSMDYEVFLVSRVAEARRAGLADDEAIVEGLARTAGTITSAAAVMIAVFAAFAVGELLLIRMLGFALAVAVLLDATLVRVALGPALLQLGGRWNWWPGTRTGRSSALRPAVPAGGLLD